MSEANTSFSGSVLQSVQVISLTPSHIQSIREHLSSPFPYKFPSSPRILFDSSFLDLDSELPSTPNICNLILDGHCIYGSKCKSYHPPHILSADCILCKVNVTSSLRQYGLLLNCSHIFCLPCIRQWRGRGNVPQSISKSCPVCSKYSSDLLPCSIVLSKKEDKEMLHRVVSSMKRSVYSENEYLVYDRSSI
jgi:hypothetical protein